MSLLKLWFMGVDFPYCSSKIAFTMSAFALPLNFGAYSLASVTRSTSDKMAQWADGWMGAWVHDWMGAWVHGCIRGCADGCIDGCKGGGG